MPEHHHHFYDHHEQPALLIHAHDFEDVRHVEESIPKGLPIYWDHEVVEGDIECLGLEEKP